MFMLLNVYCHAHTTRIDKDSVQQFGYRNGAKKYGCIINSDLFILCERKKAKVIRWVEHFPTNFSKCATDVRSYLHTIPIRIEIVSLSFRLLFSCKCFKYVLCSTLVLDWCLCVFFVLCLYRLHRQQN